MTQQKFEFASGVDVSGTVDLRIMETTDLHVHLHPYDYYADCPNPDLGLARLAELVDVARQRVPNCLLFDNGDFLQGTPVGDYFAYDIDFRDGDLHPVTGAMNALRYDAITLGNHEFNYGLDFLLAAMGRAEFPIVSANILRDARHGPRPQRYLYKPYTLLERAVVDRSGQHHTLRVGVLGVAPPQIMLWESQNLQGRIHVSDMVNAARACVPEMREAGADLIVLLAHSGLGPERHVENMENAVIPLAGIEGVDVVLSGHSHQLFPSRVFAGRPGVDVARGTVCGKPTVMSGFHGSHLGVIDLTLLREGGTWRVHAADVRNCALRDASMNFDETAVAARRAPLRSPEVRRIITPAHEAVLDNIRTPIGATETPLNSFFAYLGRSAATAVVAEAQRAFVAGHLADTELSELPLLSAVAPAKVGGLSGPRNFTNVAAGELTLRALADLYVYPNRVAALRLSGAQIALWLERAASAYNRIRPGLAEQRLMNPAYPGYNFEIIYGLGYEIDLTAPPRYAADGSELPTAPPRIHNITYGGRPLDPRAEFLVATNSYRAQGAGGFAGTGPGAGVLAPRETTRDILRHHVRRNTPLRQSAAAPFRLRPVAGASAVLRTGVAAHEHLDLIADLYPQLLGVDNHGFLRIGIAL